MNGYLTSNELCRLTGLPMGTLKRLRADGWLKAAKPGGRGRGHADLWSLQQVLAIAVSRGLRTRGVSLDQAEQVLLYLWNMPAKYMEVQFRRGQTCLFLAGTQVLPRLFTQASIFANEHIDYATAASVGMLPAAVDVQRIWERIRSEARNQEEAKVRHGTKEKVES
ncbi:MAG TPA: hypothetical protein VK395_23390 [Gemmataceae bacterium]|nr:hypothetical protein [Gemmataceae bacterium]